MNIQLAERPGIGVPARQVELRAERDAAILALKSIRDRYVKRLPGVATPKCTLCGSEDGQPHSDDFNCGIADKALRAIENPPTKTLCLQPGCDNPPVAPGKWCAVHEARFHL